MSNTALSHAEIHAALLYVGSYGDMAEALADMDIDGEALKEISEEIAGPDAGPAFGLGFMAGIAIACMAIARIDAEEVAR